MAGSPLSDFLSKLYAIIPAAGVGRRFGGKKQFWIANGKPVLDWVLEPFMKCGLFARIVVCLPKVELEETRGRSAYPNLSFVEGGVSRAESVQLGFSQLNCNDDDTVLIHDAARPCVSIELIHRVAEEVRKNKAVIPVVPLADTIKEITANTVSRTVDREKLVAVQTPQGFSCSLLRRVYKNAGLDLAGFTDEAMMVEAAGHPVHTVLGEKTNLKITSPEDLRLIELILKARDL